jgi:hypothetical protein
MTRDDILRVFRDYQKRLERWTPERCPASFGGTPGMGRQVKHARWMIDTMITGMEAGDVSDDNASRWLGFVQGLLWASGLCTIEEMRGHNRTP